MIATDIQLGDLVPLSAIKTEHVRRVVAKVGRVKDAEQVLGVDRKTIDRARRSLGIKRWKAGVR